MRIGILTDIHGDHETMVRIIDHLETKRVDRLVCLGDLVVHGPAPNRVVDWFRQRPEVTVVKGNHDIGATIAEDQLDRLHFFSPDSRANTEAARRALSDENKAYLTALPLEVHENEVCFTHAARGNPFALLRQPETIARGFDSLNGSILIAGHTHRTRVHHWPATRPLWCTDHPTESGTWVHELVPGDRYIINVGCTAQLKYDPFPPVCAVYEPGNRRLEFHELPDLRR
ncbi:MAG: metallophosphoesterase family protein [Candidatus Sericytochromatia bacterium]|nr:metallophosphoesterase family protein [Candidatus Sericytochromatia bacterium]